MSAKKAATARVSNKKQVDDSANVQTAKERRAADAQLRIVIDKFAPSHRSLVATVRKCLRKLLPTACEIVYEYRDAFVISFSPNDHGYEGVFSIKANESGVKLYLNRGKDLPDPEKLLQGSGTQVRFIPIEAASVLKRPGVVRLIDEAIALNAVAFATEGNGSLIFRTKSPKSR